MSVIRIAKMAEFVQDDIVAKGLRKTYKIKVQIDVALPRAAAPVRGIVFYGNIPVPEAEAEGMSVEKYYGTYNGSVAVIIGQSYYSYPAVEINSWDTIGGVVVHYWSYDRIQIWLEN